jgi:hypothetical protein
MKPETSPNPDSHPEKPTKYFYFLDGVKVDVDTPSTTGAAIRAKLPADKAGYAIYLEAHGKDPDRLVTDTETFVLEKEGKLHFYSVPPANFGSE